jgi:hypothetical protein
LLTASPDQDSARGTVSQPSFPEDARWNAERQTVEFEVEIGEYRGVVRVPRRVFQRLLPEPPTPERCVEAYYLQRTRFERIAERKLRRRQLTEDGNVEISGPRSVLPEPDPNSKTTGIIKPPTSSGTSCSLGERFKPNRGWARKG